MEDKSCRCKHHGGKVAIVIVLISALTAIAIISLLRDRLVNQNLNQVIVVGQGRISYVPDIAKVTLGVQIDKAAKAEEALNQLSAKMTAIAAVLKAAGLADQAIQTANYSLYPQYDYQNNVSKVSGYSANEQLIVKVSGMAQDRDKVSRLIAAASQAGANQVLGIDFDVSNIEDLKQQARLAAIADAKAKAGKMAEAAGVRLGGITGWWENVVQAPGVNSQLSSNDKGGMGGATASEPAVQSGSQEVVIEMNLNYRVK